METRSSLLLLHAALLLLLQQGATSAYGGGAAAISTLSPPSSSLPNNILISPTLHRSAFPPDFIFGTLTLALKHEGAASPVGGLKVDSVWDTYALQNDSTLDGTSPASGGDEFNRYKDDIELVAELGMDAFRISIAWTRMFPDGGDSANPDAIAHYNDLIDRILAKGVEPHVTLWVTDHPQALEDRYGGMLSPLFIDDFVKYANACFAEFGDRVKYWVTFDEPNDVVGLGYAARNAPPGRCSTPGIYGHGNCTRGNSSTEPYLAAHNILLAHAATAKLYKNVYQNVQGGYIGITLWFKWYEPLNEIDSVDIAAAQRARDFNFGWFMDPLTYGVYPTTMRTFVGSRLPSFTLEEAKDICASLDFVGINMATAIYATNASFDIEPLGYFEDMRIQTTAYRDGIAIGEADTYSFEHIVPWCITRVIDYMKSRYQDPPIYITQMGWPVSAVPYEDTINDTQRVEYFHSYYNTLSEAVRDGGNVRGVFAWSLVDGFEAMLGLALRFGLFYVDENFERYPRLSAFWHKQLLAPNVSSNFLATSTM